MIVGIQIVLGIIYIIYFIWRRFFKDKLEINLLELSNLGYFYIYFLLILNLVLLLITFYTIYKEYKKEEIKENRFLKTLFYPFAFLMDSLSQLHLFMFDRSIFFKNFLLFILFKLRAYVYVTGEFILFNNIIYGLYFIPKIIFIMVLCIDVFAFNTIYYTLYCLYFLAIPIIISILRYCLYYISDFNINLYARYFNFIINEKGSFIFVPYKDKLNENPFKSQEEYLSAITSSILLPTVGLMGILKTELDKYINFAYQIIIIICCVYILLLNI